MTVSRLLLQAGPFFCPQLVIEGQLFSDTGLTKTERFTSLAAYASSETSIFSIYLIVRLWEFCTSILIDCGIYRNTTHRRTTVGGNEAGCCLAALE